MVQAQAEECTIIGRLILDLMTNFIFEYKIIISMISLLKCFRPFDWSKIVMMPLFSTSFQDFMQHPHLFDLIAIRHGKV